MGFSLPFFKKKSKKSIYFGLYITDSSACGFVFEVTNSQTYIISQNTYGLTSGFDKILEDIDNLISELELKTNQHLSQTIFFLHSWMIDADTYEIKDPYKNIIKQLSKDLELEPLGYIDVKEALEQYFLENSIVNTVAIEVNKTKLGVSIIKGGRVIHEQYIARTDEVGDDLNSIFKELPKHVLLPGTMKVFGDEDKAEISSKLAAYEWDSDVFPEHPIIEVIKQDELNQTLVETFAKEMLGNISSNENGEAHSKESGQGQDSQNNTHFGFVEGKDILSTPKPQVQESSPISNVTLPFDGAPEVDVANIAEKKTPFSSLKNMFSSKNTSKSEGSSKKKMIIVSTIIALSIVSVMGIYEYFLHTLHIRIYLKSKTVDQTFDIDIPIKDTASNELAVLQKSISNEYSNKKNTTGSREIGDSATGTVLFISKDNTERIFPRGTELKKNELVFLTDTEVKVPASKLNENNDVETGKAKVSVTAKDIGEVYNIPKDTQLQVESLPTSLFLAIAENAFKGGSKKEVSTISTKDMETLKSEAEKQAEKNTENVLGDHISSDEIVIPKLTKVSVAGAKFSGEVGEEANSLSITAKSEVKYFTIQKDALLTSLQGLFSKELSSDYKVDPENIEYSIENIDENKNEVVLTVDAIATTHKDIELDKVKSDSRLQMLGSLEEKLKQKYEIETIEVETSFGWMPFLSSWSPLFSKNISISTSVR
ncbi:hypothetical protein COY15_00595 [Candidatus Roizmanbacteria bacterium CG_4_10_14_0_2_um_filter_39_12]|nr:MAG: hypothetical protein COY15_00595 [Candidatus Roizmanbacteria bacterium CG_4_10_14_0_2_um_filter_39_12]